MKKCTFPSQNPDSQALVGLPTGQNSDSEGPNFFVCLLFILDSGQVKYSMLSLVLWAF